MPGPRPRKRLLFDEIPNPPAGPRVAIVSNEGDNQARVLELQSKIASLNHEKAKAELEIASLNNEKAKAELESQRLSNERFSQETEQNRIDRENNRRLAGIISGMFFVFSLLVLIGCAFVFYRDQFLLERFAGAIELDPEKGAKLASTVVSVDSRVLIAAITGSVAQVGAVMLLVGRRLIPAESKRKDGTSAPDDSKPAKGKKES